MNKLIIKIARCIGILSTPYIVTGHCTEEAYQQDCVVPGCGDTFDSYFSRWIPEQYYLKLTFEDRETSQNVSKAIFDKIKDGTIYWSRLG
jgi:hypothetical protein